MERISIRALLHPATSLMKPAGDMSARRARREGIAGCRVAGVGILRGMCPRIVILLLLLGPFSGSRARGDLLAARLLLLRAIAHSMTSVGLRAMGRDML